jgi:ABC-type nitrate/sulfonate/bicarbonate transport system substrate-binding protein
LGAHRAEKAVNRARNWPWLLLGTGLLLSCSRSSTDQGNVSAPPDFKPLMSQAAAEALVAQRFPVHRYVVNDFIPKPGAPPPAPIQPPRTLQIGLYWVLNDELTPWYIAEEKGFFAQVGLKIQITEGGPGRDMLGSLISNRLDMYVGPAENALFVINSRTGTDLKMICALLKQTPAGLIGIDNSVPRDQPSHRHIGRADLIGRRIAMTPGGDYIINIICSEMNIAPQDIHVMAAGATPDVLLTGAVDYYAGFRTNQPRVLERKGYKNWTFFPYSDVGMNDYFDVSIVTADFYKQQPQVLTNYVYALNEAIQYEIAHPDEAADITVRYTAEFPETKAEALWRIKQDIQIYLGDGSEPPLAMNAAVVQKELAMLYRYRQIELPSAPGAP